MLITDPSSCRYWLRSRRSLPDWACRTRFQLSNSVPLQLGALGADFLPDAHDRRAAQQEVAEQLHVASRPEDDLLEEQSLSSAS